MSLASSGEHDSPNHDETFEADEVEPPEGTPYNGEEEPEPHIPGGEDPHEDTASSIYNTLGVTTRSGWRVKVTQRAKEIHEQRSRKWVS